MVESKKSDILIFAFSPTIAEKVLDRIDIKNIEKRLLSSSYSAINEFVDNLDYSKFRYIIGMGVYSGRDKSQLRLETVYRNKFRNNIISKTPVTITVMPFMQPSKYLKIASGIGNSWCNLVSYKVSSLIDDDSIKYNFLHIPKLFNEKLAIEAIKEQISLLTFAG